MRAVWKYQVPLHDYATVSMPRGAEILHVAHHPGSLPGHFCLWALVDLDQPAAESHVDHAFRIAGTGHKIDDTHLNHVGTFLMHDGVLVFHVFEIGQM